MDDKDRKAVGNGAAGATIGGILAGPPGAIVGGILGLFAGGKETAHNTALRDTAYAIASEVDETGTLYVDHIKPDGAVDGGTASVIDDLHHHPDIIYKAGVYSNLIIEVETADSLESAAGDALSQLEDFSVSGYRRTLVVPESDVPAAEEWVEYHRSETDRLDSKTLYVRDPQTVVELL